LKLSGKHKVEDLSPLTTLPQLSKLFIEGERISDLRPLCQIPTLCEVTLHIEKWQTLPGAAGLQERGIIQARNIVYIKTVGSTYSR
jgi:hypothetical protein